MGKATDERIRYNEKRRLHEHRLKVDVKYHHTMEKAHRNDAIKYNLTKSSRSFADDEIDVCESDDLKRRHRHHNRHHRRHHHNHHHHHHHHSHRNNNNHHRNNHEHNRQDQSLREHEHENEHDLDWYYSSSTQREARAVVEAVDAILEGDDSKQAKSRALSDSPALISVSSSHSSLSATHYSHSPAVIVDSESSHGHNNQQITPIKNNINNNKRKRNDISELSITPNRSHSHSNSMDSDIESISDSKTTSTPTSSKRSKTSTRSRNNSTTGTDSGSLSPSASASASASGSGSGSGSDSDNSDASESMSHKSVMSTHSASRVHLEENNKIDVDSEIRAVKSVDVNGGNEEHLKLPDYYPGVQGCRSVEEFQCLNRIEEGTYGVVYRAKDKKTNELVALKRLKMEKETEGFPITSLREINTLLKGQHPNIVTVREIVVGSNMDQIFIVMDYVEHDMKSLMQTMRQRKQSFLASEVKCLTQQLLRAVAHLHDNWILHRDLKTSNLLLSHKGILKVADFGLAREYGSPLKRYTPVVVTLWYRAPELLLCSTEYSTPVDMWSVGCIFAEWLLMRPFFTGEKELDQLNRIFKELGTPNEKIWPGYKELPGVKNILSQNSQFTEYPISNLRKHFNNVTTDLGLNLLQGMLTYDPIKRVTAERALHNDYFSELPLPIDPSMFPTWPAKSEGGAGKKAASPKPPPGGTQFKKLASLDGPLPTKGAGFQLKF